MSKEPDSLPAEAGEKDGPITTPSGDQVGTWIEDLIVRPVVTRPDGRGEVAELLRADWDDVRGSEMVHAYLATLEPGVTKGWVCHERQEDRGVHLYGRLRWALYDGREDSPTKGVVMDLTFTERNRSLMMIPRGVWHKVMNVGTGEAAFVNLPTSLYDHSDPDKRRLPPDTDLIPSPF